MVKGQLGHPQPALARAIATAVSDLRTSIRDGHTAGRAAALFTLRRLGVRERLLGFLGKAAEQRAPGAGWLYVLSTREARAVLKIGMTTRPVMERVRELNSSTAVLVPFGVRRCWPVADPAGCERQVHSDLAPYRIRPDREFFRVDIGVAEDAVRRAIGEVRENSSVKRTMFFVDRCACL